MIDTVRNAALALLFTIFVKTHGITAYPTVLYYPTLLYVQMLLLAA
jgi:hypothetical protein